jgi:hypothetical protein
MASSGGQFRFVRNPSQLPPLGGEPWGRAPRPPSEAPDSECIAVGPRALRTAKMLRDKVMVRAGERLRRKSERAQCYWAAASFSSWMPTTSK